jgi:hypothetical protein
MFCKLKKNNYIAEELKNKTNGKYIGGYIYSGNER